MPFQIKIELTPEAQAVLRQVQTLPERTLAAIAHAKDEQNNLTVRYTAEKYMSFPKDQPTTMIGLRAISSRLRGSLRASKAVTGEQSVESGIGSNMKYAAIQELGGRIHRSARSGSVRLRTDARGTLLNGRAQFAKAEHKRAKEVAYTAAAHDIEIPARRPIQKGIEDRAEDYASALSAAIVSTWEAKP